MDECMRLLGWDLSRPPPSESATFLRIAKTLGVPLGIIRSSAGLPLPDCSGHGVRLVMTFLASVLASPAILPSERERLFAVLERLSGQVADVSLDATRLARDFGELFGREFAMVVEEAPLYRADDIEDLAAQIIPPPPPIDLGIPGPLVLAPNVDDDWDDEPAAAGA